MQNGKHRLEIYENVPKRLNSLPLSFFFPNPRAAINPPPLLLLPLDEVVRAGAAPARGSSSSSSLLSSWAGAVTVRSSGAPLEADSEEVSVEGRGVEVVVRDPSSTGVTLTETCDWLSCLRSFSDNSET